MKSRLFPVFAAMSAACGAYAFSHEEARALYVANLVSSSPGVSEIGEYVFVVQEGAIDYDDPSGINAAVLKGQLDAVEKYVGKPAKGFVSPFSPALTEKLLPLVSFKMPECKSCKVDETRLVGKFRHVGAFEAEPLRKARAEASSGRPAKLSNAEWAGLVSQKLKSMDDEAGRESLWAEIGAAIPLVSRLGGARWIVARTDGVALYDAMSAWRGDETAKECNVALGLNPAFLPARRRLADIAFASDDFVTALSRRLKASMAVPDPEGVSAAATCAERRFASPAWREYSALYAHAVEKSTLAPAGAVPMWRYLVNSFGHLEPVSAPDPDAKRAVALFNEGKALFSKGCELERLTDLFRQSLETDPSNSARWRYFAAALRAAGRDVDAAVAYSQVLSMNHGDWTALADMAAVCKRLGFRELAVGCAWHVLAASSDEAARAKADQMIRQPE